MSYSISPSVTSQGSAPPNRVNALDLAPTRHRKSGSTGGGRAWSNEEETYLVEARQHKTPYKHISEHLKKTELACRLHFHQTSFGTKRRRRAAPITSTGPIDEYPHPPARQQHRHSIPQRQLLSFSPASPPPPTRNQSVDNSAESPSNTHNAPILFEPRGVSSQDGLPTNALRLITAHLAIPDKAQTIDTARLTQIYHAHRIGFWTLVARDYGPNASPTALEEMWRKLSETSSPAAYPPTPSESPRIAEEEKLSVPDTPSSASTNSTIYSAFSPVNARPAGASAVERGSFGIASLLTQGADVRVRPTRAPGG